MGLDVRSPPLTRWGAFKRYLGFFPRGPGECDLCGDRFERLYDLGDGDGVCIICWHIWPERRAFGRRSE